MCALSGLPFLAFPAERLVLPGYVWSLFLSFLNFFCDWYLFFCSESIDVLNMTRKLETCTHEVMIKSKL